MMGEIEMMMEECMKSTVNALDFVVVQHNTQDNVIELTRNSQRTNALELKVPSIIRNRIF